MSPTTFFQLLAVFQTIAFAVEVKGIAWFYNKKINNLKNEWNHYYMLIAQLVTTNLIQKESSES